MILSNGGEARPSLERFVLASSISLSEGGGDDGPIVRATLRRYEAITFPPRMQYTTFVTRSFMSFSLESAALGVSWTCSGAQSLMCGGNRVAGHGTSDIQILRRR
jgi:hypothetical protein